MLMVVMRRIEVTGDGVRRGDVVEVGGLLHRVRDVLELRGRRKRLEFEDGNVYVLGPSVPITVAREYDVRGAFIHSQVPDEAQRHRGDATLQRDFG